ncbi:molybdate ABC transporter substrate-binding protein [Clostridium sp. MB40-C1]|uniref:molybdate ABC transporter substrate-binding protein n=1 Tax=Clostridium sp. MB40-C1 TaxID=3070996 RepID=UPI0027E0DB4F|nr:molybdate ABC transporter substrate-binding protein [Clostridium sp. MB40-C1]WMJ79738.1 molybdate ABC transporter substrate-binding protein [Clostridium sp. MB40-C1]
MFRLKKICVALLVVVFGVISLIGCGNQKQENNQSKTKQVSNTNTKEEEPKQENKSLLVYCGAALRKPMDEVGKKFQEKYGVQIKYTYGACEQNLSQIQVSKKGDVYIPGSLNYYEVIKEKKLSDYKKDVAYHVPVIAVPKENPKNIKHLEDLGKEGVKVILGNESTAVGKISKKVLGKNKLYDKVKKNVVVTTATANEIVVDLKMKKGDASILWEENAFNAKDIKAIQIPKDKSAISTIPACVLNSSQDKELSKKFVDFVVSSEEKDIFKKYGFKTIE